MGELIKTPREIRLFNHYKIWLTSNKPIPKKILTKFKNEVEGLEQQKNIKRLKNS